MVTTFYLSFRTPFYTRINMVLDIFHFCICVYTFGYSNDPILSTYLGNLAYVSCTEEDSELFCILAIEMILSTTNP